ncbi:recombinase family protein [Rhodoferax sp. WC2427]|uniref:recombinase family protein n=1 Tax=Rhodoferax sp. WC2427 TaxID=3234144 RepID=UPI003465FAC4
MQPLTGKGICVTLVKENLTFEPPATGADAHKTAYTTLMLQLLGAVGQFERALIKERQREGIAIAKTRYVYKGRKQSLDDVGLGKNRKFVADGMTKVQIAEKRGISRASVYVYLKASGV